MRPRESGESGEEFPVIELPQDEAKIARLDQKLIEYLGRIRKLRKENPYQPPEDPMFRDAEYKITILGSLLKKGSVNARDISRELNQKFNGFDKARFENAYKVINDYCKTGGEHARGGTGLK